MRKVKIGARRTQVWPMPDLSHCLQIRIAKGGSGINSKRCLAGASLGEGESQRGQAQDAEGT